MNFIKRLVRDYKINKGLMPLKTVTLSSGVVLEHFVIREEKTNKRLIRIELKK
tara:strand:- start:620 stop:778 length:159 start_codon:yes stop_codon:yes gene_type:complete